MTTSVVHWHVAPPPSADTPDASWWDTLAAQGWFAKARTRPVVVYVARTGSERRVVATARGLLAFLRRRFPEVPVEILDPRGRDADWPDVARVDLAASPWRRVGAPCLPGGVDIPGRWLEPFFLVTIAGAAPHPRYRVSAVLAAQAELLGLQPGRDLDVVFEAHRLLAADVNVACGSRIYGEDGSESWWAGSTHDAALEAAIAAAAGAAPLDVPPLAHLVRHETASLAATAAGAGVPRLEGYLAPRSSVRLARAREWWRYRSWTVRTDLRLAAANLNRIPQFVRRRWPSGAQGAS